jgi:hypothetical protein
LRDNRVRFFDQPERRSALAQLHQINSPSQLGLQAE